MCGFKGLVIYAMEVSTFVVLINLENKNDINFSFHINGFDVYRKVMYFNFCLPLHY
jgi:hypothetical protein